MDPQNTGQAVSEAWIQLGAIGVVGLITLAFLGVGGRIFMPAFTMTIQTLQGTTQVLKDAMIGQREFYEVRLGEVKAALAAEIRELREANEGQRAQIQDLQRQLNEKTAELEKVREELEKRTHELADLQRKFGQVQEERNQKEAERARLAQRVTELEAEVAALKAQIEREPKGNGASGES